jgi:hypothetical protein
MNSREELIKNGKKVSILYRNNHVYETLKYQDTFYSIENLSIISEISQPQAILNYLHPLAKDLTTDPKEMFQLTAVKTNWSPQKSLITFKTPENVVFEYQHDYIRSPQVKTLSPGDLETNLIATYTDKKTAIDIVLFNDEYFSRLPKGYSRISEADAVLYYISPKTTNRPLITPEALFPSLKTGVREGVYHTADKYSFEYQGDTAHVKILSHGLRQLPKLGTGLQI